MTAQEHIRQAARFRRHLAHRREVAALLSRMRVSATHRGSRAWNAALCLILQNDCNWLERAADCRALAADAYSESFKRKFIGMARDHLDLNAKWVARRGCLPGAAPKIVFCGEGTEVTPG
jgi:hypothetical protein